MRQLLREEEECLRMQKAEEEKERRFLYRLGNDFESHVITTFDSERFDLIHRTPTNEAPRSQVQREVHWEEALSRVQVQKKN